MQQKKTTKEEYQKCVNVVVEYINQHLGEDIDLKSLARISNFSPFYFHRIMKAFLGEPIGTFIVRTRTEAAARLLRYSDIPIADIAYRIFIPFFLVESVQTVLWYFSFRVSKQ